MWCSLGGDYEECRLLGGGVVWRYIPQELRFWQEPHGVTSQKAAFVNISTVSWLSRSYFTTGLSCYKAPFRWPDHFLSLARNLQAEATHIYIYIYTYIYIYIHTYSARTLWNETYSTTVPTHHWAIITLHSLALACARARAHTRAHTHTHTHTVFMCYIRGRFWWPSPFLLHWESIYFYHNVFPAQWKTSNIYSLLRVTAEFRNIHFRSVCGWRHVCCRLFALQTTLQQRRGTSEILPHRYASEPAAVHIHCCNSCLWTSCPVSSSPLLSCGTRR
jgi:hypothetical protein